MAERLMTSNYVNINYFDMYFPEEDSHLKGEIIVSLKRPNTGGYPGFYVTQKGKWGVYVYSSSTHGTNGGVKVGMHITHVFEGNPKIEEKCNVIVKGKTDAIVKKLIYPPVKKTSKKMEYKWQWEDGQKGSGQWKNYIPKDDATIEALFKKKGKQCTLKNSWGTYIIDLTYTNASGNHVTGTQKKQASGWVRPIRRVRSVQERENFNHHFTIFMFQLHVTPIGKDITLASLAVVTGMRPRLCRKTQTPTRSNTGTQEWSGPCCSSSDSCCGTVQGR